MGDIEALAQMDFIATAIGVLVVLYALKAIIEIIGYYRKKFRIKTGSETDKETIENRITKLEEHDNWQYQAIQKISDGIDELKMQFKQKEKRDNAKTVATLRCQLYDMHNKFVCQGYIDRSGLKTFTELGKIYEEAGGDDIFHDKLKPEVMALSIKEDL